MSFDNHENLLADIATLYFKRRMTQAEIASLIGYSRSAISRLLSEAEKLGIVEINIKYPIERVEQLENQIKEKFNQETIFVVKRGTLDQAQVLRLAGRLGAIYAETLLHEDSIVDISWGTGVYEVVNAITPRQLPNIKVVQIIGAAGGKSDPNVDGPELARRMAEKFNASYFYLPAPLLVDSPETRQALLKERDIQKSLEIAYQADFALVGVGSVDPYASSSSFLRAGYLTKEQLLEVKSQGGVGNICGTIYTQDGTVLDCDINNRLVAVDLIKLRESPCKVIGIATGEHKVPAIYGALRGKFLNALVTDSEVAEAVIAIK